MAVMIGCMFKLVEQGLNSNLATYLRKLNLQSNNRSIETWNILIEWFLKAAKAR